MSIAYFHSQHYHILSDTIVNIVPKHPKKNHNLATFVVENSKPANASWLLNTYFLKIYSLKDSFADIVYLDVSFPYNLLFFLQNLSISCPPKFISFFFTVYGQNLLSADHAHRSGLINWGYREIPMATVLRKSDFPSLTTHQLP